MEVIWLGSSGLTVSEGDVGDVGDAEAMGTSRSGATSKKSGGGVTGLPISVSLSADAPFVGAVFEGPGVRGVTMTVGVDFTSVMGDVVGDSRGGIGVSCMYVYLGRPRSSISAFRAMLTRMKSLRLYFGPASVLP